MLGKDLKQLRADQEYPWCLWPGERHLGSAAQRGVLAAGEGDNTEDHLFPDISTSQASVGNPFVIYCFGYCYRLVSWKSRAIDLKPLFYILS